MGKRHQKRKASSNIGVKPRSKTGKRDNDFDWLMKSGKEPKGPFGNESTSVGFQENRISPNKLGFFQTETVIKVYINFADVQKISRSHIKVIYGVRALQLQIRYDDDACHFLTIPFLLHEIVPSKSKYNIRKDKIILEMFKREPFIWSSLVEIVPKREWMMSFSEHIRDVTTFEDEELFVFCDEMWRQIMMLEGNDFNYLKPPSNACKYIPGVKRDMHFKSLEVAINFYKSELKKNKSCEPLYMMLGMYLLQQMKEEKQSDNEAVDEASDLVHSMKAFDTNSLKEVIVHAPSGGNSKEKIVSGKEKDGGREQPTCKGSERVTASEARNQEANQYYKSGKYSLAVQQYLEAIKLYPNSPVYYANLSAAYMMMGNFSDGLKMSQKSVEIDGKLCKGHLRVVKCNIALGNLVEASKALETFVEINSNNAEMKSLSSKLSSLKRHIDEAEGASKAEKFGLAAHHFGAAADIAVASPSLFFSEIECLLWSEQFNVVKDLVEKRLADNRNLSDCHCLLGLHSFYQNEKENVFCYFNKAIAIDRNHEKTKKYLKMVKVMYKLIEKGDAALSNSQFASAQMFYEKALSVDPRNKVVCGTLHYNIGIANIRQKKIPRAIQCFSLAISLNKSYVDAYLRRAELYQQQRQYFQALEDRQQIYKLFPSENNKKLLSEVELVLKDSKKYYSTLGVDPSACACDITKAFKSLALQHHPDKHGGTTEEEKRRHEALFKRITEAYAVLKDPKLRHSYDNGGLNEGEEEFRNLLKLYLFINLYNCHEFEHFDTLLYSSAEDDSDDSDDYSAPL